MMGLCVVNGVIGFIDEEGEGVAILIIKPTSTAGPLEMKLDSK